MTTLLSDYGGETSEIARRFFANLAPLLPDIPSRVESSRVISFSMVKFQRDGAKSFDRIFSSCLFRLLASRRHRGNAIRREGNNARESRSLSLRSGRCSNYFHGEKRNRFRASLALILPDSRNIRLSLSLPRLTLTRICRNLRPRCVSALRGKAREK